MIQTATQEDLNEICNIAKKCFGKFCWNEISFKQELQDKNNIFLVEKQSEIIAYCISKKIIDEIEVLDIAVLPSFQNQGIATKLLETTFLLSNAKKVYLEVSENNKKGISLYQNLGFKTYLKRTKYYQDGSDAICMQLDLPRSKPQKIERFFTNTNKNANCELVFKNNYELLVSVILSAQCTDKRVNTITPSLFKIAPTPKKLSQLSQEELEAIIKSCGFYHNKAKHLLAMSKDLVEKHNEIVPSSFEELTKLEGVGRKTANVIMSVAFNQPAIAVDTHVFRVATRLGLNNSTSVLECEKSLCKVFKKVNWSAMHSNFVLFGRYVCKAQSPNCINCACKNICNYHKKVDLKNKLQKKF